MTASRPYEPTRAASGRAAGPALVGRINRRSIFEHFLTRERASLRELADALRLSDPTVRKAVGTLTETGLLEELPEKQQAETGRPGSVYRLALETTRLAGVSLSASTVEVVESGLDGRMTSAKRREFATPHSYPELLTRIADAIRAITPQEARLVGVGLSVPGEVDLAEQRVVYSPNLHVTDGRHLARDLQRRLKLRDVHVAIYKDTACGCLVERLWGAAEGKHNFVVLGVREGFGAGIWSDGRLLLGRRHLAPEIGHIPVDTQGALCSCGKRGCLETVATDVAFAQRVALRYGLPCDVDRIIAQAARGELDVAAELALSLRYLALGLATIVNIFAPELICLDSRLLDAAPDAFARLRALVDELVFPSRRGAAGILQRVRIDNSRGALAAALHEFLNSIGPAPLHERPLDLWREP